jgi:RNA polymerase sigma-70 factor, ECF subfamily
MKQPNVIRKKFEADAFVHLDSLWRTALWLTRNEDKASDLVQRTFVLAFKDWNQSAVSPNCRTLLFTTLSRLLFQTMPDDSKLFHTDMSYKTDENIAETELPSLEKIPCNLLGKAFANIPAENRLLVILSICWGFSYGEIADMVGEGKDTVRSKMLMGRQQLKAELIKDFIASQDRQSIQAN